MSVRLVVGAALVRDGRVLACRRTAPREAAGRWEFPGGKVEDGESPGQAVVRELAEELGVEATVTGWLDGVATIGDTHELRVAVATVVDGVEPAPVEHDATRWLASDELDDVDWLEPDRPFLAQLAALLAMPADRAAGAGASGGGGTCS
jgi:8-oxo-dGTP diphosphatase